METCNAWRPLPKLAITHTSKLELANWVGGEMVVQELKPGAAKPTLTRQ